MITNSEHFKGEIYLAQVGATASTKTNKNNRIQGFIDLYEPELLEYALGKQLSNEFYTNIDPVTGTILGTADPKWDRLLNGHSYVKNNITYYWRGLIETKGSITTTLMAYYIYYKYVNDGVTQNTTLGRVKADGKNANAVDTSAIPSMTQAYRKMHEWYGGNDCYNTGVHYRYKGAYVSDYFGGRNNTRNVSLFQFLTDNENDYDNWNFTYLENQNQFGL